MDHTLRTLTYGDTVLTVGLDYDDPDFSYIDHFASWRGAPYDAYVYDMREHVMADPERVINGEYRRIWRNERGRMVAAPDTDDTQSCEYRFIVPTPGGVAPESFRDAWQTAEYLDAYARQQWTYVVLVATVAVDGVEIGRASIWGIEWDHKDASIEHEYVRDVTREALDDAKAFRARLSKAS